MSTAENRGRGLRRRRSDAGFHGPLRGPPGSVQPRQGASTFARNTGDHDRCRRRQLRLLDVLSQGFSAGDALQGNDRRLRCVQFKTVPARVGLLFLVYLLSQFHCLLNETHGDEFTGQNFQRFSPLGLPLITLLNGGWMYRWIDRLTD